MNVRVDVWRSERKEYNGKQVRDFIGNLALVAEHDPDCTFLYRGESERHERVSSGLYRQFHKLDDGSFDISEAQKRQLKIARAYAKDVSDSRILAQMQYRGGKTNPIDFTAARAYAKDESDSRILAQIQHRGGKTNLIDFTADLNIALFFACYYSPDKDGRVIFLHNQQWDDYSIRRAIQPSNMADAQKSYFVEPKKSYIREDDITTYEIPSELKEGILRHLRNVYGIEPSTVYSDISGFIRDQDLFPDLEADFSAGMKADAAGNWDEAICFYTKCLDNSEIGSQLGIVNYLYYQRGVAQFNAGNFSEALADLKIFDVGSWEGKPELPEHIRNWYSENRRGRQEEMERQRESQRASDAETAAGIHPICIEAQDPDGSPVDGARFKLLSEDGYEDSGEIKAGRVQALIPGECCGSKCLFWLNKEGYRGVNPVEYRLGDSFTVTLKPDKCNADPKEVTIKVTYEITEAT